MEEQTIAGGVTAVAARTPTLPPATHTNSYALGEREVLLVEPATPFDDERRDWLAWVRAMASQGRVPQALVLTHHHPDHIGGATFLAQELSLPIWAHPLTASRIGDIKVDRLLQDGETLVVDGPTPQRWQCLLTPGHAPGHLCFHEPTLAVAVVGDMVASVGTIVIDPIDGDMHSYLAQLQRLIDLDLQQALPAHGGPILQPNQLFEHYIAHRLGREQQVMAALQQLTATAPDNDANDGSSEGSGADLDALVAVAYATTPKLLWPLAKLSLEAHLIKLESDGRARRLAGGAWRAVTGAGRHSA